MGGANQTNSLCTVMKDTHAALCKEVSDGQYQVPNMGLFIFLEEKKVNQSKNVVTVVFGSVFVEVIKKI